MSMFRKELLLALGISVIGFSGLYLANQFCLNNKPKQTNHLEKYPLEKLKIEIENEFNNTDGKVMKYHILSEMREGLNSNSQSSLKMLPSFVTKLPKGNEKGHAYALDMGGSNLRVLKVELDGSGNAIVDPNEVIKEQIPQEVQNSTAEDLFGFIADCVKKVIKEKANLGFTFSFPVNQASIASGILIHWTKGFSASGVEKCDVVALLNKAFETKEHFVPTHVNALINDTVGTLLCGAYSNLGLSCPMGLILGTGANGCYLERISNIKKLDKSTLPHPEDEFMIVNMESGNFGARRDKNHLPLTKWDNILDEESNNSGQQLLEKQVSGKYLGEILRIILDDLIVSEKIFTDFKDKVQKLQIRYGFPTSDMSEIEGDETYDLRIVDEKLKFYGVARSSLEERKFVKSIVHCISSRAANLVAAQIAAVLEQVGLHEELAAIAIDGSVFEKYPNFPQMISEGLENIMGHNKVKLVLAKDGSGVGAAIASFLQQ